ncbi:hypothetical protein D3C87_332670 [compost metagenome]
MEKQIAIVVGVGAVAAALVGGLGWKTLKSRPGSGKMSQEAMDLRKEELRARLANKIPQPVEVQVVHQEADLSTLRESGDPVLAGIASMMVETTEVVTEEQVIHNILQAEPPKDVLTVIEGHGGQALASVSRIRAVTQPDQTPMFWSSFINKIRRPDILALTSQDFEGKNSDMAKGYHNCTVDGVAGVLHVTKSNVSAVIHLGGDSFAGISTTASRFGGKGLNNLTVEQAKNFLNGR